MNAVQRLAAYAGAVAVVFGGAYVIAGAAVPESAVAQWEHRTPAGSPTGSPSGTLSPHPGGH